MSAAEARKRPLSCSSQAHCRLPDWPHPVSAAWPLGTLQCSALEVQPVDFRMCLMHTWHPMPFKVPRQALPAFRHFTAQQD